MIVLFIGDGEVAQIGTYVFPDAPAKEWEQVKKKAQAALNEFAKKGGNPYDTDKAAKYIGKKIGYAVFPPEQNAATNIRIPSEV